VLDPEWLDCAAPIAHIATNTLLFSLKRWLQASMHYLSIRKIMRTRDELTQPFAVQRRQEQNNEPHKWLLVCLLFSYARIYAPRE
jgi:hypothetical protein